MKFEHLSKSKNLKKKKIKKFFEFQVNNVTFLNILLHQNLEIKIVNVPLQDHKNIKESNFKSSNSSSFIFNVIFVFLILMFIYIYFYNIFIIWYNENMTLNLLKFSNNSFLITNFLSCLNTSVHSLKKLNIINNFFNSFLIDFLNFYNFI